MHALNMTDEREEYRKYESAGRLRPERSAKSADSAELQQKAWALGRRSNQYIGLVGQE